MEMNEVEELLNGTQYETFIGSIQKVTLKDHVYDNLFRIGNEYSGYFELKIRKKDPNIIDSIECIKMANDVEEIINKNIGIIENEKYILTISEWLTGNQPIDKNRDRLPIFFSKSNIQ